MLGLCLRMNDYIFFKSEYINVFTDKNYESKIKYLPDLMKKKTH